MNLKGLIDTLKMRPAMYIGSLELRDLRLFLDGYIFFDYFNNLNDGFDSVFRKYFNTWVWIKLVNDYYGQEDCYNLKYENGRGYVELIAAVELEPEKQLNLFFKYFDLFYEDYLKGVDFEAIKKLY